MLDHNHSARSLLRCASDLAVVPGATHFFEEPGARDQMTDLAIAWFTGHLSPHPFGGGAATATVSVKDRRV